jgi:hypothetical protein
MLTIVYLGQRLTKVVMMIKRNSIFSKVFLLLLLSSVVNAQNIINTNKGLPSNKINDIIFDGEQYYIASDLGVIQLADLNNATAHSVRNTSVPVNAIANAGEYIWVGLASKGLYRMHKTKFTFEGQFREEIGRPTIKQIIAFEKSLYLSTNEGEFKINSANQIQKISTADFVSVIQKTAGELKVEKDTLYVDGTPFIQPNPNAVKSLFKNEDIILLENGKELFVFDQQLKTLNKLNISVSDKINQLKQINGKWWLCTDAGLQSISLPSFSPETPKLSIVEIKFDDEVFESGNHLDYTKDGRFSIHLKAEKLGNEEEISFGYSLDGINWIWKNNPQVSIHNISYENEKISFAAKNIRGQKTEVVTIEYFMESPAEDQMWNWIFIGLAVLTYTFIVVWIAVKKKNSDIKILEEALLDKTNKLNQLEKSKYGLVEEKKVKI